MTTKEKLFQVMGELAKHFKAKGISVIICLDTDEKIPPSIIGYRNKSGYGNVTLVAVNKEAAIALVSVAWEVQHNPKYRNGSNSEQ